MVVTELEEVLVKVIGVGDGGNKVVEKMSKKGMSYTVFIAVNTNVQTLSKSQIPIKIQVDESFTKRESKSKIRKCWKVPLWFLLLLLAWKVLQE